MKTLDIFKLYNLAHKCELEINSIPNKENSEIFRISQYSFKYRGFLSFEERFEKLRLLCEEFCNVQFSYSSELRDSKEFSITLTN